MVVNVVVRDEHAVPDLVEAVVRAVVEAFEQHDARVQLVLKRAQAERNEHQRPEPGRSHAALLRLKHEHQAERQEQVKVFLHAQRPRPGQGIGFARAEEVIQRVRVVLPRVFDQLVPASPHHEEAEILELVAEVPEDGERQDEVIRRENAHRAAREERPELHRAGVFQAQHQNAADQKAAEHVEHVQPHPEAVDRTVEPVELGRGRTNRKVAAEHRDVKAHHEVRAESAQAVQHVEVFSGRGQNFPPEAID